MYIYQEMNRQKEKRHKNVPSKKYAFDFKPILQQRKFWKR